MTTYDIASYFDLLLLEDINDNGKLSVVFMGH